MSQKYHKNQRQKIIRFLEEVGILIAIRDNGFRFLWLSKLVVNFQGQLVTTPFFILLGLQTIPKSKKKLQHRTDRKSMQRQLLINLKLTECQYLQDLLFVEKHYKPKVPYLCYVKPTKYYYWRQNHISEITRNKTSKIDKYLLWAFYSYTYFQPSFFLFYAPFQKQFC